MAEISANPKIFKLYSKIYDQKKLMFLRPILEEKSNVDTELPNLSMIRFSPHIRGMFLFDFDKDTGRAESTILCRTIFLQKKNRTNLAEPLTTIKYNSNTPA